MNEKHYLQISQFLDDELDSEKTMDLLRIVQQQPALMAKKNRYELVRGVLKSQQLVSVSADFAQRIQQEINQEKLYVAPKLKSKPVWRGYNMMALVASIAVVAIITDWNMNNSSPDDNLTKQLPVKDYSKETGSLNARIIDYIQDHNGSGYSNGESFMTQASLNKKSSVIPASYNGKSAKTSDLVDGN